MLKVFQTEIKEVLILEYEPRDDNSGTVFKNYSKKELEEVGI